MICTLRIECLGCDWSFLKPKDCPLLSSAVTATPARFPPIGRWRGLGHLSSFLYLELAVSRDHDEDEIDNALLWQLFVPHSLV